MSSTLDRLADLAERVRTWPRTVQGDSTRPIGNPSPTIIALHRLTDAALPALIAIAQAAELIRAYEQAGGNEWWEAHAKLYLALDALDEIVAAPVRESA